MRLISNSTEIAKSLRWLTYVPLLFVILTGIWLRTLTVINHDVAWMLIAANRMIAGGGYTTDFFEINMPLAIAIYAPPPIFANLLGLKVEPLLNAWVFVLIAQSTYLCARLAYSKVGAEHSNIYKPLLITWIFASLCLVPGYDFGQREHLLILLILPWLFLIFCDGAQVNRPFRVYVSVIAGIGFYLKPHFVLLPVLILGLAALRARSWRQLVSLESIVLSFIGCANAAFVILVYDDWFKCARWASDLYWVFQRHSTFPVLFQWPVPIVVCSAASILGMCVVDREFRRTAAPFALVATYGFFAYLLQFKGWSYQFLPTTLTVFLLQGFGLWFVIERKKMHSRRGTVLVAVASVGVLLVLSQAATATRNLPRRSLIPTTTIAQAFSVAHPNDPVYVFSTTMLPTFPTVTLMGLKWGSRFPSLWPLAGLEAARALGRSDASELQNNYADKLRQMVYEDFKQYRPIVVLVDVRQGQFGLPRGYQILEFFKHNVLFSRLWTRYREIGRRGEYLIYALKVEE